jgi:ATP-dependent helicase/nuclease subunit A
MTIHGAKGLEAPIVFLADTCSFKAGENAIIPLAIPGATPNAPKLPVWTLKGVSRIEAIKAACEVIKLAEREEYHRLLYVAMTRARDRLYVAGFENGNRRSRECWWDLIDTGLRDRLASAEDAFGNAVGRLECPQAVPCEAESPAPSPVESHALPDWLRCPVPEESP